MATNKKPKHQTQRKMSKQEQAFCNLKLMQMANNYYLKGYQRGIDTVCAQVLWALHTQEKDPWGNKRLKRLLTEINKFTHDYMDKGNNSVSIEDIVAQLKEECGITINLEKGDFDFGEDGNKKTVATL